MSQIIDVPGQGHVEFPDSMNDADIVSAIQHLTTQTPALMNPHVQAQGTAARANMTPPTSVMDPRYPAYASAQQGANTMDALGGLAGMGIGGVLAPGARGMQATGRWLMRSALKPSPTESPDKVARGIETMLQRGETVSQGGVSNLQTKGNLLHSQVADILRQSEGAVPLENIKTYPDALISRLRYSNQVESLAAARSAKDRFLSGETIQQDLGQREKQLSDALLAKRASAQGALQDAGRFATTAAQQENLAHGGATSGTPIQHVAGETGNLSPSAYPVSGYPRIPGRYTANADRVPEATGALTDALVIVKQRQREAESIKRTLESLPDYERAGMVPVEQAQAIKQGLYARIGDKGYGLGLKPAAERDTLKAIANGLRMDIEKVAPEVAPINAEASDIWNALNLARRRVATAGNKDPLGLGTGLGLIYNPEAAIAFHASRSEYLKSALANVIYRSTRAPGIAAGGVAGSVPGLLLRRPIENQGQ